MIYPASARPQLDPALFERPTSEYRGAPFWAWNGRLEKNQLLWQLAVFQEMGFGGAHLHVRVGLETPYLGDEFMAMVRACTTECERLGLKAWLYDEDRWPSGAAGGLVTRDPRYRLAHLLFTPRPYGGSDDTGPGSYYGARVGRSGGGSSTLVRRFAVTLKRGKLSSWRMLAPDSANSTDGEAQRGETRARESVWYLYIEPAPLQPWFNNQTYLDTMNPAAAAEFVRVTHERYLESVGKWFGSTIPAIFTDEPQYNQVTLLPSHDSRDDVILPWTADFNAAYLSRYGESFLDQLPLFVWQNDTAPTLRYRFFDLASDLFALGFADVVGKWCADHRLALTGHLMEEPTLSTQTRAVGEAMRSYRSFQLPGIDMLCDGVELTTAKQAQSAARQYGREGVLSELYGVTGWDFDFRGHKLQGDWQAALGVTVRVPHLAWVTMEGEAKRDYPASIGYQSPWHRLYPLIEDHFARLNTVMTRGKPLCRVAVIHPIESVWLAFGPDDQTGDVREGLDREFEDLASWLLRSQIDFDYVSESMMETEGSVEDQRLCVGEMAYDAIVLPGLTTIRHTTIDLLSRIAAAGGTVIQAGGPPTYVDGVPDPAIATTVETLARTVPFTRSAIVGALEPFRDVEIIGESRVSADSLLYQLRRDSDCSWLLVTHVGPLESPHSTELEQYALRIRGAWSVTLFDTAHGTSREVPSATMRRNGEVWTRVSAVMACHDSLLLRLEPEDESTVRENAATPTAAAGDPDAPDRGQTGEDAAVSASHGVEILRSAGTRVPLGQPIGYELSEPNVLLLDCGEWRLDGGRWQEPEEVLRLDNLARGQLGWPPRGGAMAQPWVEPDEPPAHTVSVRHDVTLDVPVSGAHLAIERTATARLKLDGQEVPVSDAGCWVDESIRMVPLPDMDPGAHVVEITNVITRRAGIEWSYLLGRFGVSLAGAEARIVALPDALKWGDITTQGFPFYSGNVTYEVEITVDGSSADKPITAIQVPDFSTPVIEVSGNEKPIGFVHVAPYVVPLEAGGAPSRGVREAARIIRLTAYGNRHNAFGPIHHTADEIGWYGPQAWRTTGSEWSYEYHVRPFGILSAPAGLAE